MTDDRSFAEPIPIVHGPAEFMNERRHEQRWVSDPPGDDNVCTCGQRLNDRSGAQIGVRGQHAVAKVFDPAFDFEERKIPRLQASSTSSPRMAATLRP